MPRSIRAYLLLKCFVDLSKMRIRCSNVNQLHGHIYMGKATGFFCFYGCLLACLVGYVLPIDATLVVAIPTKEGLIVAADSRVTLPSGQYFDIEKKLNVVESKPPLIFAVTGYSAVKEPVPPGKTLQEWFPVAPHRFQGSLIVQKYLQENLTRQLTLDQRLTQSADALASCLNKFFSQNPQVIVSFHGRELCRLSIFQANGMAQSWGSVPFEVSKDGRIEAKPAIIKSYKSTDAMDCVFFDPDYYTTTHVLRGQGRAFLPERAKKMVQQAMSDVPPRIQEISANDGAFLARAIIQAAETTTKIIPVPSGSGIGGPVYIYLVTPLSVRPVEALQQENMQTGLCGRFQN